MTALHTLLKFRRRRRRLPRETVLGLALMLFAAIEFIWKPGAAIVRLWFPDAAAGVALVAFIAAVFLLVPAFWPHGWRP